MSKKFKWVIGALVIALLAVGAYGATAVYADDSTPPQPFGERGPGGPGGPHGGRGLDGAALEAVANVLDMSTDDLSAALEDGKTLQELADEAGVDMQEVFDAMNAVRAESMRERIAQAVEDGTMTQEKADWLLEGLDKGFLDGGPGFGFGLGGHFEKGVPPSPTE
ncbi:MAG: hypothetical protein JW963_05325 [Anaerolineales bacterium]|nr:hypothetical protein [Anaerolineales bacterium]